ncbi:MAG TPA: AAA family ATPase, partial [Chloroflexota bacterium]|nr:AAA family ATPase [Chloroflexota bacterium]
LGGEENLPAPTRAVTLEEKFSSFQQNLPSAFREQLLAPAEGENRTITILFADLSASVKTIAALQPEDAAALVNQVLQAMVDAILKYEGRINRMLGDGVLAFFGVPQAHENDPERAIRAALELRDAVQALGLNVTAGINTGEVYLGSVGPEQHHEFTALGATINLASRLQGKAQPGQILVGEVTYRQCRRAFEFEASVVDLKGLSEPVTAYEVLRPLPRPDKVRGLEGLQADLIGREAELSKLLEAFAEVRQGRGQVVNLIGEAGLGKSRLVAELKRRASAEDNLVWLEGRSLEFTSGVSYWPFLDALREYLGWQLEDGDAVRIARLVSLVSGLAESGGLSPSRAEEMLPFLGNLLSIPVGGEQHRWIQRLTPEQLKHQTFLALVDLIVALAQHNTLVLVLEDLHWTDSHSLDVISLLMDALRNASLLLVCVYRPEREHRCWQLGTIATRRCPERYTEISLRELTPSQGRRLIESLLRIDQLPDSVKAMIIEKAQGNPFFVEEVIRSLVDAGLVYQVAEHWQVRQEVASLAVPATIQAVILSRVDRLEDETKRILQSAAVIGRLFGRRLLGYVIQQERGLEQALGELEERELIYQERVIPEEEFSFRHVLTQETVYGGILRRRRTQFHRVVAEGIEGLYGENLHEYYEQLAYHYGRSGVMDKAVEYLVKSGEKAHQAYANEEALSYYQQALTQLEGDAANQVDPAWEVTVHRGLGLLYHRTGKPADAEQHLRRALARGKEHRLPATDLARVYASLGQLLYWQMRHVDVEAVANEGLALLGTEAPTVETIVLLYVRGSSLALGGNHRKRLEVLAPHLSSLENLPFADDLRLVYFHSILDLASFKQVDRALHLADIFEQKANDAQDRQGLGYAAAGRAWCFFVQGDLREAVRLEQVAIEHFSKVGEVSDTALTQLMEAWARLRLGDLEGVERVVNKARDLVEASGLAYHLGWVHALLGIVALCRNQAERAAEAFNAMQQTAGKMGGHWLGAIAYYQGRAALAQGKSAEAVQRFEEALASPRHRGFQTTLRNISIPPEPILASLDDAVDDADRFQELEASFRAAHPRAVDSSESQHGIRLTQWHLEPTTAGSFSRVGFHDEFAEAPGAGWTWHDSFGDCSSSVGTGLEIRAVNGRDLWESNVSAPRVIRTVSGDFAAVTICEPAASDRPGIGGLVLWHNEQNYVVLERGRWGASDVSLRACVNDEDTVIGRGRLVAQPITLRMERVGDRVTGLCSADGVHWQRVGSVDLPVGDVIGVGVYAGGEIDRSIYNGAFPDGTAMRFAAFEVGRRE